MENTFQSEMKPVEATVLLSLSLRMCAHAQFALSFLTPTTCCLTDLITGMCFYLGLFLSYSRSFGLDATL